MNILTILEGKWEDGTRPADLYERRIAKKPGEYVDVVLEGLASKKKRVQSGCAEIASRMSADSPKLLIQHVAVFLGNLRAKEPILRWEAVCTLGNLAAVDDDGIIAKNVGEIAGLLGDKSIVLQGHAVRALAKIATKHPELAADVLAKLLASERYFPGSRVGYIVEATETFAHDRALAPKLRKFLALHAKSPHAPVARKAKRALSRIA